MNIKKIKILLLLTLSIIITQPLSVVASSTPSTSVKGNISATIIKVSLPADATFTINPNVENNSFVAPDILIDNQTTAPIKVSVASKGFKQSTISAWKPTDVLSIDKDWIKLGSAETNNNLALGLKIKTPSEWRSVNKSDALFVKTNQVAGNVVFGEMHALSKANLTLEGFHGNAFKNAVNCTYDLQLTISLAD